VQRARRGAGRDRAGCHLPCQRTRLSRRRCRASEDDSVQTSHSGPACASCVLACPSAVLRRAALSSPAAPPAQVREYISQLETHLAEALRQATRLIRRQTELGSSMSEFGTSMVSLGKFEAGALADSFTRMGEKADVSARHTSRCRRAAEAVWQPVPRAWLLLLSLLLRM
jgi:hypothetical protein